MYWASFLHFYQPPDQSKLMLSKVVNEGYRPLLKVLLSHPNAKMTFNVSGCLFDLLGKYGYQDVIDAIKKLADNGQIELTASAKYHPFLPYLAKSEILRQIDLNNRSLKKYLGKSFDPKGFYSPEAAYSFDLAKLAQSLGYLWMIVDEVGFSGRLSLADYNFSKTPGFYSGGHELGIIVGTVSYDKPLIDYSKTYKLKGLENFYIFFRERVISDAIASGQVKSAGQFLEILGDEVNKNRYLLTGTDGEAYGHHQPELEKVLDELLSEKAFTTVKISELPAIFTQTEEISPYPCSWGTSEKEIAQKNYYSRWRHPDNKIHTMQWQLNDLAIKLVNEAEKRGDRRAKRARGLLDQALYSCHFWWASARPWWSIEMIERGAKALLDVVDSLDKIAARDKAKAKDLYLKIILTAFEWLRKEIVWDLSHAHA